MSGCGCSCEEKRCDRTPLAQGDSHVRVARSLTQAGSWLLLGGTAAVVLGMSLAERAGVFEGGSLALPWWLALLAMAAGGARVLGGVVRAASRGRVTGHTLMTLGAIAASAIGQWGTAVLLVFFMRLADWVEGAASRQSRRALDALMLLQPVTARIVREGVEVEVPLDQVCQDDTVVVRSGERIPVDGVVLDGEGTVDQAAITGESMPADLGPGDRVFAATISLSGFLRIRALRVASGTTFAQILRLVEEAESRKSPAQRLADRFASWYIPLVLVMGVLTYAVTGQVLNGVAVLVVSCACAVVMATPLAVVASVGQAARQGLVVKGGAVLETLARVDTLVVDKTGTLTRGDLEVTEVCALPGRSEDDFLQALACAEARSEHPVAQAVLRAAAARGLVPGHPRTFQSLAGRGIVSTLAVDVRSQAPQALGAATGPEVVTHPSGREWAVGTRRFLAERGVSLPAPMEEGARALEDAGRTVFFAAENGVVAGMVAVSDVVRPGVAEAIRQLRALGLRRIIVLTGDSHRVAAAVARDLGLEVQAGLLPEDKIAAVRALQDQGAVVMMVGDGVNDAPALAQADVGVAMGRKGADVSLEVADAVLMREDWSLVPALVRIARRAVGVIRQNLMFALVYNGVGITLAALGILPPVWGAAAQSLPDVLIMVNSARLLRATPVPRGGSRSRPW